MPDSWRRTTQSRGRRDNPTLEPGCSFAAFCVWLTVRYLNRRKRWAKWTLIGQVAMLPVFYMIACRGMLVGGGQTAGS
jgi:hypothetical protein